MKELTEKELNQLKFYRKLLHIYTLGNLMLEHCDDFVQSNPLAVRELKQKTNAYIKFLEKNLDQPLKNLYDTEEDIFQILQEAYSVLIQADIEDIPKIAGEYLESKNK